MNSRTKINGRRFQFLGSQRSEGRTHHNGRLQSKLSATFRRRRPAHDPMLVLNMTIFNFADGWNQTFNPFKAHQTVG
jgi:hypothetical protein